MSGLGREVPGELIEQIARKVRSTTSLGRRASIRTTTAAHAPAQEGDGARPGDASITIICFSPWLLSPIGHVGVPPHLARRMLQELRDATARPITTTDHDGQFTTRQICTGPERTREERTRTRNLVLMAGELKLQLNPFCPGTTQESYNMICCRTAQAACGGRGVATLRHTNPDGTATATPSPTAMPGRNPPHACH